MSCPDCFQGHVHEGTPRGAVTKLYGLDAYVSEPADGKTIRGIIVIIPDAFGWDFVNNRHLADHYADKSNFKVYLPDFMHGHSAPMSMLNDMKQFSASSNYLTKAYHVVSALYAFIPWILKNRIGRSHPVVEGFFSQLRKEEPNLPVGAAGFCWGGKHAVLLAQGAQIDGRPLLDAAFAGHPSFIKVPGDVEKLTVPISVAVGDKDSQLSVEQAVQVKTIVDALPGGAKGEVRIYENCGHGFCVRADVSMKDSEIARQADEAEDQCIAWFNEKFPSI